MNLLGLTSARFPKYKISFLAGGGEETFFPDQKIEPCRLGVNSVGVRMQKICPEDEFPRMMEVLKSDLPSSFRITGSR
jgi:hypothetical protein